MKYGYIVRCMGVGWLVRRALHRLKLKSGSFRRRFPCGSWEEKPLGAYLADPALAKPERYAAFRKEQAPLFLFDPGKRISSRDRLLQFDAESGEGCPGNCVEEADTVLEGVFRYFSRRKVKTGFPPDWFANHFQEEAGTGPEDRRKHWSEIDDFSEGDIKVIWELSRFGFVYPLVRAYWRAGDAKYEEGFWRLIEDWRGHNPPQTGPHWKCGQEIAFRLMAWIFGLYGFFDSLSTTPGRLIKLVEMIAVSAERIEGNIPYALSQKNNHPISEAMGLWTVGILFPEFRASARWKKRGREILERCARELIYPDGTFSQHSVNYHRLMLDDYTWVLALARKNGESFSQPVLEKVRAAAGFLREIAFPGTGRAPNLGANDGSLILPLSNCGYPDFRSTVQAAGVLMTGMAVFTPGPWNEALFWLGVPLPDEIDRPALPPVNSLCFNEGGYLVLRGEQTRCIIRCTPKYRHRPSHADQLHLDLWKGDVNILRDSGTFSYNAPPEDAYFAATGAHNTVEFDSRDQMPRLSRFLSGEWLAVRTTEPLKESGGRISWAGAYRDWRGCTHERRLDLDTVSDTWTITDRVSGYHKQAVLRWRLAPEIQWDLEGSRCVGDGVVIDVRSDQEPLQIKLAKGLESLYYWEKNLIPVLEVALQPPCAEVRTEIIFTS